MEYFSDNTASRFDSVDNEEMEMQLWGYIDGVLPAGELSAVERMVAENAAWKAKYHELLHMHQSLLDMDLEQPSMSFTRNVMEDISRLQIAPATKEYINQKIIWGIAAFFVTLIVAFVGYAVSQVDWSVGGNNNDVLDKITGADYSKIFNNTFVNAFMMLNVVLGLMLFDRYLANKKKQFAHE